MRAVQAGGFGGPEVLATVELPDPVPGPGEVSIQVAAADVMYLDARLRQGWGREFFPLEPPYVPGGAVAGEVVAIGEGVDESWIGRRVAARTAASGIGSGVPTGGYAQLAVAKTETVTPLAEQMSFVQAAALIHDGRTALGVAERAVVLPGEWVLITAAAGGLGVLLTQLARRSGAKVIAAVRGQRKAQAAKDAGADIVVDYADPAWTDRVREATAGVGVDVIFDGAGGPLGTAAVEAAAPGARFIGYGAAAGAFADIAPERDVTFVHLMQLTGSDIDWDSLARRAFDEAAAGTLVPLVGQTFPLDRAAAAHAAIESREALGRTILLVD